MRIAELQWQVGAWAHSVFGDNGDHARMEHLRRESVEVERKPKDASECADIALLLLHQCWVHGHDLEAAILAKFEACKRRNWGKPDAHGVVEHVRYAEDDEGIYDAEQDWPRVQLPCTACAEEIRDRQPPPRTGGISSEGVARAASKRYVHPKG